MPVTIRPLPPAFAKMVKEKLDTLPGTLNAEQKQAIKDHFSVLLENLPAE